MELFVVGYTKGSAGQRERWGFVNVASDVLLDKFGTEAKLRRTFPTLELRESSYRDGGQHQISLACFSYHDLDTLLKDQRVQIAAGHLALRVMRKRATIYSKFHCKQLADRALAIE